MTPKRKSLDESARDFFDSQVLSTQSVSTDAALIVPLKSIRLRREQPRRYFAADQLQSLAQSIKDYGILEPLLVRPLSAQQYELVAGERRYLAAEKASLTEVPVVSRSLSDSEALEIALIENLQREDLNPVEETEGILQLLAIKESMTGEEVISGLYKMYNSLKGNVKVSNPNVRVRDFDTRVKAVFNSLGRMSWESFVKNQLPLLKLPAEVLEALRQGKIEYTKAKAIAQVKDSQLRQQLLEEAISQSLSLTQIRERRKIFQPPKQQQELQTRWNHVTKQLKKSKFWNDSKKTKKLSRLLIQMEKLIAEEENE